ncbi:hypothetical protein PILCRDRAFT_789396 [Piloderma croceum F 1598]|uniref:Major facilitator superfamily (MFS) profile domain-containing protein n=1 Tax=Piloderma croceum (strain F 1598) TaxID=765440 RepID=A0A0C3BTJ4_PILCF|nr:hypothetical protein PILCRDRAFT_789396 [Piloderma croceum F 1598]
MAIETPDPLTEKQDRLSTSKGDTNSEPIDFGGDSKLPPPPQLTAEQEKKLWRKIDMRLMPILSLMYLTSFLDRGNAKLHGLVTQLDLTGNKYNIALTMYFIVRIRSAIDTETQIHRRVLSLTAYLNVHPSTCHAARLLHCSHLLFMNSLVLKAFLNFWQFPPVSLTLWYPRHYLQYRVGLFFGAASLAGAFSGLLAYGISFMNGTAGLLAWSWIFILEGIVTVLVGFLSLFVLVDFPSTAKFLTLEERALTIYLINTEYNNSSVGEEEAFAVRHVWAAFTDWQVWVLSLSYHVLIISLIDSLFQSPVKRFGHSPAISSLLTVPPFAFATIVLFLFAYYSDKMKIRSPFILAGLVMCLFGYSINISTAPTGAKYFGTFFVVAGSYAALPGVVSWLGNNLCGQYKRGVGMALHIGIGNFSGAIASNIYRTQDGPRYVLGHGLEMMFVGIGLIALPAAVLLYKRINAQRDVIARLELETGDKKIYTSQELRDLGDKAPDFRYIL